MTSEEKRSKAKDVLIIIATSLNIILSGGAILGLMKWISEVNSTIAVLQYNQKQTAEVIKSIQEWQEDSKLKWSAHDAAEGVKKALGGKP